jgi:signal transduction histidine kinase
MRRSWSLRVKLLAAVIVCAVLPLAAVGAWLVTSVSRAGERLLEAQLDSIASRAVQTAVSRWEFRKSDLVLLSDNEPVRAALSARDDSSSDAEASVFLSQAFASMPGVASVVVRDRGGRVRWSLGLVGGNATGDRVGASEPRRDVLLQNAVHDASGQDTLGVVEARVRLDGLLASPSAPTDAGSGFVAVHNRVTDAWAIPTTMPASLLEGRRFEWERHRWAAVGQSLDDPPVDFYAVAPADAFTDALAGITGAGAIALAAVAAGVLLLTMVVTTRLTSSLARLADAADAVSRGDLDLMVPVGGSDEVARVARTFNNMMASLRAMMGEQSQREAVAAMGELAATLAHQVRSPATAMRLDLERARKRVPEDSPERILLTRALDQLDRLERAVSGSLRVARSGAVALHPLDARGPLRRAIEGIATEAAGRDVTVSEEGFDAAFDMAGDGPSLEQLFTNLLANAVQASRSGGQVTVRIDHDGRCIAITDDGEGMPPEVQARAGEAFFSTKPEGIGLGLTIAKRIAAAHGATLGLFSGGVGTVASVKLGGALSESSLRR